MSLGINRKTNQNVEVLKQKIEHFFVKFKIIGDCAMIVGNSDETHLQKLSS